MIRKTAIAVGVGAALLVAAAGTAFAAESAPTNPPTAAPTAALTTAPTSAPTAAPTASPAGHGDAHRLFRGEYAQWTTFDPKTNTSTVHDAIRGSVTAVSSSSITVKAADGTAQTYAVGADTKVHAKGDTKAAPGTIGQVKVGDRTVVVGTGQGSFTATHVLDRGAPAPAAQ